MKTHKHIIIGVAIGAITSALPDVILASYRWKENLEPNHPLAKLHRFSHSYQGLLFITVICWGIHLLIDWYTHPPYLYMQHVDKELWQKEEEKYWGKSN